MDSSYTPYMVYVKQEGGKPIIDLTCLPTELLTPVANAIPTEVWKRSERTTFKADHDAMNLAIEPKQLTLFTKKII